MIFSSPKSELSCILCLALKFWEFFEVQINGRKHAEVNSKIAECIKSSIVYYSLSIQNLAPSINVDFSYTFWILYLGSKSRKWATCYFNQTLTLSYWSYTAILLSFLFFRWMNHFPKSFEKLQGIRKSFRVEDFYELGQLGYYLIGNFEKVLRYLTKIGS